jgi:hypothetical protein
MFPSPSILYHYTKFNICTIAMVEKLLGMGSFGGFIGHCTHHQTTILVSLDEFDLFFVV